jgi:hypothetical protein
MHRLVAALVGGVLLVTLIGGVIVGGPSVDSTETTTVTVVDAASTAPLVTYEVAIADTYAARVQGLSGTDGPLLIIAYQAENLGYFCYRNM